MAIELSKEDVEAILPSIQRYISEEFGEEISDFKARLLLDYVMKEIGPYAYNQGVKHAETYFRGKLEDLPGTCYEFGLTYWTERAKEKKR